MLRAKKGINPVEERRQREAADKAAAAAQALSLAKLVERYRREHLAVNFKPRSAAEIARLLGRTSRFLADKPVASVSKADVLKLLSQSSVKTHPRAASAGGRSEASNLLKVVRRAFRWALAHDLTTTDPTLGVVKPLTRAATRNRVLDDAEIVRFWHGCEHLGYPFGPLFQLLLSTGQRRREVGELSRE